MSNKNEQAYPTQEVRGLDGGGILAPSYGLTKRELIAAMAMQGIIEATHSLSYGGEVYENTAFDAVKYADALLEALK